MESSSLIRRSLAHLLLPIGERFQNFVQSRLLRIAAVDLLIVGLGISIVALVFILLGLYGINPLGTLWSDQLYRWISILFFL